MLAIQVGFSAEKAMTVTEKDTARTHGSGLVDVLSTPAMIALMEGAAVECVDEYLADGQISVGTGIDIKHMAAIPIGIEIYAKATICRIDGRLIVFRIEAWDSEEKIGEGTHTRFVVEEERFLTRTNRKYHNN